MLLISSLLILPYIYLNETVISFFLCSTMLWLICYVWKMKQLSAFCLFLLTFAFLFIGGRFWAKLIDDKYIIQSGTFFEPEILSNELWYKTLILLLLFLYGAVIGYSLWRDKSNIKSEIHLRNDTRNISINRNEKINKVLKNLFYILAIYTICESVSSFMIAFSGGGYLSLYAGQSKSYTTGGSLAQTILYALFGIAMAIGSKQNKIRYIFLFTIQSLITIAIGSRGSLGALLLFFLWLYAQNKPIRLSKIILLGCLALFLLLFLASISIRAAGQGPNDNIHEILSLFFYQQGISLAVFAQSMDIDYPIIPYFQSFIPGFSALYSIISGQMLHGYDVSFNTYLAYYLNPELFYEGYGLGWTLMSDIYCFSQGWYIPFFMLSIGFGYISRYLEERRNSSNIVAAIYYSIFLRYLILPRASVSTIAPLAVYVIIVYFTLKCFSQLLQTRSALYYNEKNSHSY